MNPVGIQYGLILLVSFGLIGCDRDRPIYQVESHSIPKLSPPPTLEQIESRIIEVEQSVNWHIRAKESSRLRRATSWERNLRHMAVVLVEFDRNAFNILHESPEKPRARTGKFEEVDFGKFVIHRKYNMRIRTPERLIDVNFRASDPERAA